MRSPSRVHLEPGSASIRNLHQFAAAFAVASLLAALALVTLGLKYLVERRMRREGLE